MKLTEARGRVKSVLLELSGKGIPPFEDTGWMNPEDWSAIVEPLATLFATGIHRCPWSAQLDTTLCPEHGKPLNQCPVAGELKSASLDPIVWGPGEPIFTAGGIT